MFVCESRYLTKAKSFKKIKMWPFTAEPFKLRHRTVPLTARRVESVFAQHASSTSSAAKMAAEADSVISSVTSGSSTMCARVAMDNVDDNPYTVSEHVVSSCILKFAVNALPPTLLVVGDEMRG